MQAVLSGASPAPALKLSLAWQPQRFSDQRTHLRMKSISPLIPVAAQAARGAAAGAQAAVWRVARRRRRSPLLLLLLLAAARRCAAGAPRAALGVLPAPRPQQGLHVVAQHVQQGLAGGVEGSVPHLRVRRHGCTGGGDKVTHR